MTGPYPDEYIDDLRMQIRTTDNQHRAALAHLDDLSAALQYVLDDHPAGLTGRKPMCISAAEKALKEWRKWDAAKT